MVSVQSPSRGAALLLDRMRFGVVMFDDRGRVVSVNPRAANLLARGRSLLLRSDELHCHDAQHRTRLADLLSDAAAGRGGAMLVRAAGEPALVLYAIPLDHASVAPGEPASGAGESDAAPCFAIVLGSSELAVDSMIDFAALHGLTPAERRVLAELAHDRGPEEIADRSGVSVRTVRHQLSSVYDKVGVSGQRELLLQVSQLPPFAVGHGVDCR